ncbi:uncharacterized protein HMPREF1541_00234 [Cyphellophora europaea CBS 101466]|uniref:Tetrapyrrole biosynthesis uroporphyrinogen III synthase domain-containing protein n=1 Tax=Cyphellophora europaea (strain CBS 101466) TaxID=1220924 RepID=W2SBE0_CYPE1|nr:uncharacterized protein HMPREF1541_00234 [Cyphellophora europaea CBS 101466]ETN46051.1 hypothetical protein HMPREF1541_00234 [Cyphellophora europaea CBS 101466]
MAKIPVFLLKTRSQPEDGYEEYFSQLSVPEHTSSSSRSTYFEPRFVPVLEHRANTANLSRLEDLLRSGRLTEQYGGIIFTSQRAVEGFSDVVRKLDRESTDHQGNGSIDPPRTNDAPSTPTPYTPFPLYVVGPATSRSLNALLPSCTLASLHPAILGAHTGNGAALASYILRHYNALHAHRLFTLCKRPLLFLVGEVRRDVIPRVLGEAEGEKGRRVGVEEWEVYSTGVREAFETEFAGLVSRWGQEEVKMAVVVVVVFSPQGCEAMLRCLGFLDGEGKARDGLQDRWGQEEGGVLVGKTTRRYVVATIGPTTRDHLRDKFGFEPDVCAKTPSPEGVGDGVVEFLRRQGLLDR